MPAFVPSSTCSSIRPRSGARSPTRGSSSARSTALGVSASDGHLRRRFAAARHGGRARGRHAPHLARRRRAVRGRPVLPRRPVRSARSGAGGDPAVRAPLAGGIIAAGEGSRLRRADSRCPSRWCRRRRAADRVGDPELPRRAASRRSPSSSTSRSGLRGLGPGALSRPRRRVHRQDDALLARELRRGPRAAPGRPAARLDGGRLVPRGGLRALRRGGGRGGRPTRRSSP